MIRPERIRERLRAGLLLLTGVAATALCAPPVAAQITEHVEPVPPPTVTTAPSSVDPAALAAQPIVSLADVGGSVPFGFIVVRRPEAVAAALAPLVGDQVCPERIQLPLPLTPDEELSSRGYPEASIALSEQHGEPVCVFHVALTMRPPIYLGRALLHEHRSVRARALRVNAWRQHA